MRTSHSCGFCRATTTRWAGVRKPPGKELQELGTAYRRALRRFRSAKALVLTIAQQSVAWG